MCSRFRTRRRRAVVPTCGAAGQGFDGSGRRWGYGHYSWHQAGVLAEFHFMPVRFSRTQRQGFADGPGRPGSDVRAAGQRSAVVHPIAAIREMVAQQPRLLLLSGRSGLSVQRHDGCRYTGWARNARRRCGRDLIKLDSRIPCPDRRGGSHPVRGGIRADERMNEQNAAGQSRSVDKRRTGSP